MADTGAMLLEDWSAVEDGGGGPEPGVEAGGGGPSAGAVEEVELVPGKEAPGWTVCGGPVGVLPCPGG